MLDWLAKAQSGSPFVVCDLLLPLFPFQIFMLDLLAFEHDPAFFHRLICILLFHLVLQSRDGAIELLELDGEYVIPGFLARLSLALEQGR
jgi:hypothetical protein